MKIKNTHVFVKIFETVYNRYIYFNTVDLHSRRFEARINVKSSPKETLHLVLGNTTPLHFKMSHKEDINLNAKGTCRVAPNFLGGHDPPKHL